MKYLFVLILFTNFANAHKVNLFIKNEQNIIDIYSYFANGSACKKCTIIIKNRDKIIIHDELNNLGEYQYKSKFKSLEVIVDASGGHKVSENIRIDSLESENLQTHLKNETFINNIKIMLGIILIFGIFYILKKFKQ